MAIRPLRNNLYGVPLQEPRRFALDTNSKIILLNEEREIGHTMRVVHCGPDCKEVSPGNVVFLPYSGRVRVTLHDTATGQDETYDIVSEDAVMAIFEEE